MKKLRAGVGFFVLSAILACGAPEKKGADTFSSGEVYISVDESLEPLIATGIFNFENINPDASIHALYLPEALAYQALLSDTIKALFGSRLLTPQEESYFERIQIRPKYTTIGYDAVAFLLNKDNRDSLITLEFLEKVFKGEQDKWISSAALPVTLVFDHAGSGSVTAIKNYFNLERLPDNAFALDKNTKVVEYVKNNKGAIGILGINWINNLNAVELAAFKDDVQVALINTAQDPGLFVRPEQTYIGDSTYAFIRSIYAINRESRVGLGSGFVSFMATDRGQRIVLKSGLLPHWMPPRELIIY
jgi:phosphate transport system substrate-binding protein